MPMKLDQESIPIGLDKESIIPLYVSSNKLKEEYTLINLL